MQFKVHAKQWSQDGDYKDHQVATLVATFPTLQQARTLADLLGSTKTYDLTGDRLMWRTSVTVQVPCVGWIMVDMLDDVQSHIERVRSKIEGEMFPPPITKTPPPKPRLAE